MNKYLKLFLIIILIFLILNITIFKIDNFIENKKNFEKHKTYFEKPKSEQKIEDWMTIHYIKKHFKINKKEFKNLTNNKNLKLKDLKITLKEYCENENLNSTKLIQKLNTKIK